MSGKLERTIYCIKLKELIPLKPKHSVIYYPKLFSIFVEFVCKLISHCCMLVCVLTKD